MISDRLELSASAITISTFVVSTVVVLNTGVTFAFGVFIDQVSLRASFPCMSLHFYPPIGWAELVFDIFLLLLFRFCTLGSFELSLKPTTWR